jgi:hypothetical protein
MLKAMVKTWIIIPRYSSIFMSVYSCCWVSEVFIQILILYQFIINKYSLPFYYIDEILWFHVSSNFHKIKSAYLSFDYPPWSHIQETTARGWHHFCYFELLCVLSPDTTNIQRKDSKTELHPQPYDESCPRVLFKKFTIF